MVGLNRSPPRAMTSVTVMFTMRSENAVISGTTGGPRTTSTWARAGEGTTGYAVGTVEVGASVIHGVDEGGPVIR
jgi:hypothetical protein